MASSQGDIMSEEITESSVEHEESVDFNEQVVPETAEEEKSEQVVAWESHQKLLSQRKADQKKARQLEQEARELREQLKSIQNAKLEEKQEYKKLYEASRAELESIKREQEEKERIMVNKEKQAALIKELGGLRKNDYLKFADLENIVIDDSGQIDSNSVRLEANRFREAYPELIASKNPVRVNSQAPAGNSPVLNQAKKASELSGAEREAIKRQMLQDKLRK